VSIFKRLTWGIEGVNQDKLNDMVGNDDYLFEHMITGYYDNAGITRDTGLSIRCGYVKINNTNNTLYAAQVWFQRPFLPGVKPVITMAIAGDVTWAIWTGFSGLDGQSIPDHRGFSMHLEQYHEFPGQATRFVGVEYVSYIAIGPSA
jgi:hypothetical protein